MNRDAGPYIIFDCQGKNRVLAIHTEKLDQPEAAPQKTLQLKPIHKSANNEEGSEGWLAWHSQQWRVESKCLVNVAYPNLCIDATSDIQTYGLGVKKVDAQSLKKQRILIVPIEGEQQLEECIL